MNRLGARGPDPIRALAVAALYLIFVLGTLAVVHPAAAQPQRSEAPLHESSRSTSTDDHRQRRHTDIGTKDHGDGDDDDDRPPNRPRPVAPDRCSSPPPDTAAFQRHARALWKAVADDDPAVAHVAFFPQSAYVQIKAIADPAGDWTDRLLAEFATDVHALHAQLGADAADARLVGLVVPDGHAQWIEPGVESNSGSYWRVYGSVLRYRLPDGSEHDLPVTSLISWRGEWYVVHLGAIR